MRGQSSILCVFLVLLILPAMVSHSQGQTISTDAEWPCFRRDLFNTGISNLKGPLTELEEIWTFPLGGSLGFARMEDVDQDGFDEIFMINSGKIIAYQEDGTLMWNSPIIGVTYILDILDLDNDGVVDIVSASHEPPTVFIISAKTGEVAWQHYFPPPAGTVNPGGVKIADLDGSGDGKLELFCWPWSGGATGYAFEFRDGVANGRLIWDVYVEITWGYSPQIMVADMDCDSIPEVVIGTYGHIYAWQGDTGNQRIDFGFTTGEKYGRNYGIIKLTDIDDDPYPEVAVLAHNLNEHLTMIDNKGPGGGYIDMSVLWDKWFEYSYPEDHKSLQVSPNSMNDVDNDGDVELVCALFNDTGDSQWHLMVYDARTGEVEFDLMGYYLYDVQDLDGDGTPEIFLSEETSSAPSRNNLHILKGNHDSYAIVCSRSPAVPIIERRPALPLDVNGTSGTDVLLIRDIDFDGMPDLFTRDGMGFFSYEFENNELRQTWSSQPTDNSAYLLAAGKTGIEEFRNPLISSVDGHSFLIGATGEIISDIEIGSYYAMPIAADLDGDGPIEVLVQDALGYMNVLDVSQATPEIDPRIKWQKPGKGKSAKYGRNTTAYVDDVDNDGLREVFVASGNNLIMYNNEGLKIREYAFESYPYEWVTGYFNDDTTKDLFVAFNAAGGHTNIIHVYDGEGSKIPIWTKDYGPYSGYVVVYDFTEDGVDDIILREHYDLVALDGKDGSQWGFNPGAYYHTPVLMDTDFDGKFEVINGAGYIEVSVNRFYDKGRDIAQIWEKETGYLDCYARMPGTADVDNDGHVEMGVSSTNGIFTCYDTVTGAIEWTYDLGTTASDIICMDADNDGRLEFIFGGLDGYLYIMNGESDAANRVESQFDLDAQVGSPIVVDLNADGVAEVLVTTYDGKLHCLVGKSTSGAEIDSNFQFEFRLGQNYPNPFNEGTQIHFSLPEEHFVKLKIYNVQGQLVRTLVSENYKAGTHQIKWAGKDDRGRQVASGIYICFLQAEVRTVSRKMLLIQ